MSGAVLTGDLMVRRGDEEDTKAAFELIRKTEKDLSSHVAECNILRTFIKEALIDIKKSNTRTQIFISTVASLMLGASLFGVDKVITAFLKGRGILP